MSDRFLGLVGLNREQLARYASAELCKRSFKDFVRAAWHIHHPAEDLIWGWHLDALCAHLQAVGDGEIIRLLVNLPPGLGKSLLVSVYFPAWLWIREPWVKFLCCSAAEDVVYRDSRRHRELVECKWYRTTFRPDWQVLRSQEAKGYWVNSVSGERISRTIGQRIIGFRGDCALIDDPLDERDAHGDRQALVRHVAWFQRALLTRLNRPDSPCIVVMQRLHERDLAGVLIEEGGWEHLCMSAEHDDPRAATCIGWEDPRTEKGELLFPALLPRAKLDTMRATMDEQAYSAQYQQRPVPAEGTLFRSKWLQHWTNLPDLEYIVGSWDFAWRRGRSNDFSVGQVWGVCGAHRYLLAQVRARMDPPEMLSAMREQRDRFPSMRAIVVESKAKGPELVDTLRREIPGVLKYNPQGDSKQGRAAACTPMWQAGNVWLPPRSRYRWVTEEFVPELLAFPHGGHDDQVDAMTQALLWIRDTEGQAPRVFSLA